MKGFFNRGTFSRFLVLETLKILRAIVIITVCVTFCTLVGHYADESYHLLRSDLNQVILPRFIIGCALVLTAFIFAVAVGLLTWFAAYFYYQWWKQAFPNRTTSHLVIFTLSSIAVIIELAIFVLEPLGARIFAWIGRPFFPMRHFLLHTICSSFLLFVTCTERCDKCADWFCRYCAWCENCGARGNLLCECECESDTPPTRCYECSNSYLLIRKGF